MSMAGEEMGENPEPPKPTSEIAEYLRHNEDRKGISKEETPTHDNEKDRSDRSLEVRGDR